MKLDREERAEHIWLLLAVMLLLVIIISLMIFIATSDIECEEEKQKLIDFKERVGFPERLWEQREERNGNIYIPRR